MASFRVFVFFVVLLGSASIANAQTVPRCNIGGDPVDKDRQLTDDEAIVINPADHVITYGSGSGHDVTCVAQSGVPIVVDKATGVAKWVYGCGNPIRTPWTPKRPTLVEQAIAINGKDGVDGKDGAQGLRGIPGPRGPAGRDGLDFTPPSAPKEGSHWKKPVIWGGVITTAVFVVKHFLHHEDPLAVITQDPTCTSLPCTIK